ncbi:hypothetical protein CHU98_g6519 [Xylaria longipes]|nr:hypothetical protein CHU98_g6519 [Xylaria longipes]
MAQRMNRNTPLLARMVATSRPTGALGALRDAEELAKLMENKDFEKHGALQNQLKDFKYRDCSKYSLDTGSIDSALHCAYKDLEIERCIIGAETEHLRDGMLGAEYWLEHLNKLMKEGDK